MKKDSRLDEALRIVEQEGYRVTRSLEYVKHTFQVEKGLFARFIQTQRVLHYKVKDAVNEAITQWVESKREDYEAALAKLAPTKPKDSP